jgi:release factor glutamine methyltransferase
MSPEPARNRTVGEALRWGRVYLRERGISSYALDAGLLLCGAAGLSKTELYTRPGHELDGLALEVFAEYIRKRGELMPVQYLLNRCEFMGLDFYVDENVLIPRPDTECLAEAVIEKVNETKYNNLLDIGTGSGCIIISVLKYCAEAHGAALDISAGALAVAGRNALANGVGDRLEFIHNNLFQDEVNYNNLFHNRKFDVIASNPPYIRTGELALLEDNVIRYEPVIALDGGPDGLVFYERVTALAPRLLNPGGMVFYEVGHDQSCAVDEILRRQGFTDTGVKHDLAGHGRVVYGTWR